MAGLARFAECVLEVADVTKVKLDGVLREKEVVPCALTDPVETIAIELPVDVLGDAAVFPLRVEAPLVETLLVEALPLEALPMELLPVDVVRVDAPEMMEPCDGV